MKKFISRLLYNPYKKIKKTLELNLILGFWIKISVCIFTVAKVVLRHISEIIAS